MKKTVLSAIVASMGLFTHAALADEALAQRKGCLACHGIDNKIVGPAYKDVAKKYAGQDVTDPLSQKVIKGGGGVWGQMAMPPMAVSAEEAKQLVEWILSLK